MKKPEEKTLPKDDNYMNRDKGAFIGFNDCHDQFTKWFPSKDEIWQIFAEQFGCKPNKEDCSFERCNEWGGCLKLIEAIAKKLEVKNESKG